MEIYTTQVMIIIVSLFNLIINIQPILSQEHCNDGDHVCKLIKMHTSGFLTYEKLENVTRTLDTTLQRAIGLEINVATLNTQVTQESQLGTEMRVRLENEAKSREVEINKVLKGLAKSFNRTKVLQKQLQEAQKESENKRAAVSNDLKGKIEEIKAQLSQEATKQTIERRKIAELEASKAKWEKEREILHGEEEKEKLKERDIREKKRENRSRTIAKEKVDYEDTKIRDRMKDRLTLEEKSALRREEERRKTEEALQEQRIKADLKKAQMEQDTAAITAKAEAEGRILQERQNKDIHLERLAEEGKIARQKVLDSINLAFKRLSEGAESLIANPQKLLRLILSVVGLAAGIYIVRDISRVLTDEIAKQLGKPSLIRETSRQVGLFQTIRKFIYDSFVKLIHVIKTHSLDIPENMELFNDVILNEGLRSRVDELARSTRYARRNRAPYRHVLFYGPAGTGKSMVAKRLALFSGMDWAVMTGGDVGPLGAEAVTDLHKIFKWAKSSRHGLILFIDEAEAFLGSRSRTNLTEHMRNALNALLYQTGDQSNHFMLVLATNRPSDLDPAILDRIDEAVFFDIPETKERVKLANQYFNHHLLTRAPLKTERPMEKVFSAIHTVGRNVGLFSKRVYFDGFSDTQRVDVAMNDLLMNTVGIINDHDVEMDGSGTTTTTRRTRKPKKTTRAKRKRKSSAKKTSRRSKRGNKATPKKTISSEDEDQEMEEEEEETEQDVEMKDDNNNEEINIIDATNAVTLDSKVDVGIDDMKGLEACMEKVGSATTNFSGRQIAKLMISLQGAVYGTKDIKLTPELIQKVTLRKISENKRKREMAGIDNDGGRSGISSPRNARKKAKQEQYNFA